MKLRYLFVPGLFVLIFHANVFAQNVRVLTLGDALTIAKQNSSELILAKLDQVKAERKVSEVYSENLVPTVTLNSRYIRNFKKQVINIFGQTFELGTDNNITTSIDVSEPIPVLGTPVFSGIKIAEYYLKLQQENVSKTESKINADVKKAFLNTLLLKQVIELNNQSIENARENLRVVEARYKAGVALEFDYLRAKVKLETLYPDLKKTLNNLEIAKKFLKNTIGLKDNEEIDVKGTLSYDSTEVWGTMDNIIRNVSEKNVNVRQLILTKQINEELTRVDYANYMPKIYLFGQYSLQANENDGRSFLKYRYFNALTAGIGLTWDLNLFRNRYREEQSIIEVKKSEEQIRDVKEKLKIQAQSVLLNIQEAKDRIMAQREIVDQAERGLELATVGFKSGVLNQIDVIDAELAVSQVRLAYIQAIYDYLNARTDLELLLDR
jgi:outer membrane protein TolC